MEKINNVVRIVEFETESDLYYRLENDLTGYFGKPDSRCYKLKNLQLLDSTHAMLYFEEDMNIIMVRFISNGEILTMEDSLDNEVSYFTIQEISLIDELGVIAVGDTAYEVEEIEYIMDIYGVRHVDIYLS